MMKRTFVGVLTLFVVALVALQVGLGAQQKKPEAATENAELRGKILSVTLKSKEDGAGAVLEKAALKRIERRTFLVGVVIDDGSDNPYKGTTAWLPVDEILQIMEFASADEARKVFGALEKIKK
jgi:hypothetical protein